jgi:hypothetical protein
VFLILKSIGRDDGTIVRSILHVLRAVAGPRAGDHPYRKIATGLAEELAEQSRAALNRAARRGRILEVGKDAGETG